ncbi:MAG TPA: energy transducer TonB [Calditrichia bacterium]|nr:energy transducer TonB [Calditrichia bacterium]
MLTCKKCGTQNPVENIFCEKCHQFLGVARQGGSGNVRQSPIRPVADNRGGQVRIPAGKGTGGVRVLDPETPEEAAVSGMSQNTRVPNPGRVPPPDLNPIPNSVNRALLWGVSLVLLLGAAAWLYFFVFDSQPVAGAGDIKSLIFQGENLYNQKDYAQALSTFQKARETYPEDELIVVVDHRIEQIEAILGKQQQREEQLQGFLDKAEAAFERERYLTPDNDNVMLYLAPLFALEPEHARANEMRRQILGYYQAEGDKALSNKQYNNAASLYENMLVVDPGSDYARQKLDAVDALQENAARRRNRVASSRRSQRPQVSKPAPRVTTSSRPSQREVTRKSQPQVTAPAMAETPVETATTRNEVADSRANAANSVRRETPAVVTPPVIKSQPATANTRTTQLPKETREEPREAAPVEIPIVPEALISGGKREYLTRAEPDVPPNLDYGGFAIVRAECVVGVDGRVESVNIVSSGQNQRLNSITAQALKNYRYRPATYKGKPVRFKVLETINFTKRR